MAAINVRMDAKLKKEFGEICEELGMSISTAMTIFVKKVVREKRIPFDVQIDPFWSEENQAELRRRIKAYEDGTAVMVEHDIVEVE